MPTQKIDVNQGVKPLKIKDGTALIVSLDGTLANTTSQQAEDMNTGGYCTTIIAKKAVDRVEVDEAVAKRVRAYIQTSHPVLFLTCRPKDLRKETEEWLKKHNLWGPKCFVLTRENYDNRDKYRAMKEAVTFSKKFIGAAYESDETMIEFYRQLKIETKKIGG